MSFIEEVEVAIRERRVVPPPRRDIGVSASGPSWTMSHTVHSRECRIRFTPGKVSYDTGSMEALRCSVLSSSDGSTWSMAGAAGVCRRPARVTTRKPGLSCMDSCRRR
ncbi:unnamed protein product [Vitrella brassicaformis CCMP3155]|uniref:Uncharacterized protein n=1 Tax=Vitrella brassicaformis (strain CCMP3155) TaxID=1169540 RepID=A0A0G4ETK2_VITBC|nr:unnamed protein product [Vitrella brassicaformis CCMP3155]|eukprot:CEM00989.1 unnamed protein product [Vitrella brassicaformis CCMP3155]